MLEFILLVLSVFGIYKTNQDIKGIMKDAACLGLLSSQERLVLHRAYVSRMQFSQATLAAFWLGFLINLSRILF